MATIRANLRLTRWRGPELLARVPRILAAYAPVLDSQLQTEIQTPQFPWPRTTVRRNRSTVRSPRDIVDLGGFLRSQTLEQSPGRLTYTWDPKSPGGFAYGSLLYTGFVTNSGTIMPGRNWMSPALAHKPPMRFFAEQWRSLSGGR